MKSAEEIAAITQISICDCNCEQSKPKCVNSVELIAEAIQKARSEGAFFVAEIFADERCIDHEKDGLCVAGRIYAAAMKEFGEK